MIEYDVKAIVINLRETRTPFKSGYRPVFAIHKNYNTTGEIKLIGDDWLPFMISKEAFIRFLSPEVYPKSIWIGKEIKFYEGKRVTGVARITEIINGILIADFPGEEGQLNYPNKNKKQT